MLLIVLADSDFVRHSGQGTQGVWVGCYQVSLTRSMPAARRHSYVEWQLIQLNGQMQVITYKPFASC